MLNKNAASSIYNYFMKICRVYQKFTRASLDNSYFICLKTSKTQKSMKINVLLLIIRYKYTIGRLPLRRCS